MKYLLSSAAAAALVMQPGAVMAATHTSAESSTCFLLSDHAAGTGQFQFTYKEPAKPFPSLTQCYKNNQGSCCVSAHDAYIEGQYGEILSTTCLRQFPFLEQYYCLGCNPEQGRWVVGNDYTYETDGTTGEAVLDETGVPVWNFDLRICRSFMEFLFTPDNDAHNYDKCGLLDGGVGYLPTSRYSNASQFISSIKPPYFTHVDWVEVNDLTDSAGAEFPEGTECYVPTPVSGFLLVVVAAAVVGGGGASILLPLIDACSCSHSVRPHE
jgi:hypothetical protein